MKRPVRVFLGPLSARERRLEDAEFRYVVRVHRLGVGDSFVAFDPEARLEAEVQVLAVGRRHARCRVEAPRPARLVSPLDVTLLQCLGKADKPDRVVRDATALGAARIVLVTSSRTEVKLQGRAAARRARWHRIALDAARQSQRGDVPVVEGPVDLGEVLAQWQGSGSLRICLDAHGGVSVGEALSSWEPEIPLVVLVGPEGGLTEQELRWVREAGFILTCLGPFILRTETAATAILGALVARMPPSGD